LIDGEYLGPPNEQLGERLSARIMGPIAFGDLDGDGVGDAAVVIGVNYIGNGLFPSLIAVLNQNGQPVQSFSVEFGGNSEIDNLTIENSKITVKARIVGSKDRMCCPNTPVVWVYQLTPDALLLVSTTK
jgi:hypothetical protein